MKLRIRGALFRCGRCRKSYSNPLGHECVSRLDRPARKTTLTPKITTSSGTCPKCRKATGNPLTHTCTVKTDFRARTAAGKRQAAAAKRKASQHRYSACRDKDCKRIPCVAYKEAAEEAYAEGYANGHDDGYVKGYDQGFPDGIAACPRSHK